MNGGRQKIPIDEERSICDSMNYLKQVSTSLVSTRYSKLTLKATVCTQNIWFYNEFLKSGVFPNYIKLKTRNSNVGTWSEQTEGKRGGGFIQLAAKSMSFSVWHNRIWSIRKNFIAKFINNKCPMGKTVQMKVQKRNTTSKISQDCSKTRNVLALIFNFKRKKEELLQKGLEYYYVK